MERRRQITNLTAAHAGADKCNDEEPALNIGLTKMDERTRGTRKSGKGIKMQIFAYYKGWNIHKKIVAGRRNMTQATVVSRQTGYLTMD